MALKFCPALRLSNRLITSRLLRCTAISSLFLASFLMPHAARAHCDGIDGPVVRAAKKALETGDVNHVLIWVQPKSEQAIRAAFTRAMEQQKQRDPKSDNMPFFEVVVKEHRAGEGEPFSGIQPAGRDPGPAIRAADSGLDNGSFEELNSLLKDAVIHGLKQRFDKVNALRNFESGDVPAGRAYVAAYVDYIHFSQQLYDKASGIKPDEADSHHEDQVTSKPHVLESGHSAGRKTSANH
jgi:hypothetical protein